MHRNVEQEGLLGEEARRSVLSVWLCGHVRVFCFIPRLPGIPTRPGDSQHHRLVNIFCVCAYHARRAFDAYIRPARDDTNFGAKRGHHTWTGRRRCLSRGKGFVVKSQRVGMREPAGVPTEPLSPPGSLVWGGTCCQYPRAPLERGSPAGRGHGGRAAW